MVLKTCGTNTKPTAV